MSTNSCQTTHTQGTTRRVGATARRFELTFAFSSVEQPLLEQVYNNNVLYVKYIQHGNLDTNTDWSDRWDFALWFADM